MFLTKLFWKKIYIIHRSQTCNSINHSSVWHGGQAGQQLRSQIGWSKIFGSNSGPHLPKYQAYLGDVIELKKHLMTSGTSTMLQSQHRKLISGAAGANVYGHVLGQLLTVWDVDVSLSFLIVLSHLRIFFIDLISF